MVGSLEHFWHKSFIRKGMAYLAFCRHSVLIFAAATMLGTTACTFRKKPVAPEQTTATATPVPATIEVRSEPQAPTKPSPESLLDLILNYDPNDFSVAEMDRLIEKEVDLNLPVFEGATFLELAVRLDQAKSVQRILAMGASPFVINKDLKKSINQIATELERKEILALIKAQQVKLLHAELAKAKTQDDILKLLKWSEQTDNPTHFDVLYEGLLLANLEQQKTVVDFLPRGAVLNLLQIALLENNLNEDFDNKAALLKLVVDKYKVNYVNPRANQIVKIGVSPSRLAEKQMHRGFVYRWSMIDPTHEKKTRRYLETVFKVFDPEISFSDIEKQLRIPDPEIFDPHICLPRSIQCYQNEIYYLALVRAVQPELQDVETATIDSFATLNFTKHSKSPLVRWPLVASPFFKMQNSDQFLWSSRNDLFDLKYRSQSLLTITNHQAQLQITNLHISPPILFQLAFAKLNSSAVTKKITSPFFKNTAESKAMAFTWSIEVPTAELMSHFSEEELDDICFIPKEDSVKPLDAFTSVKCGVFTYINYADIQSPASLEKAVATSLDKKLNNKNLTMNQLINKFFVNQAGQIKKSVTQQLLPYINF